MEFRKNTTFGRVLSRIGFGAASISGEGGGYGFGAMDEVSAERLIRDSWDCGINLFDTAPIYGFGLSEERLGKFLPKEAFVVTKGGVDWHSNLRVNMSNDPRIIERMLLESLKRLRRDRIDLYMIHWPDKNIDIRKPMEVLVNYQKKGAIQHIGLCNSTFDDLKKAQEIGVITGLQSELNLFNQISFDLLSLDWKNFFSMGWGTFDKGILSGRVTRDRQFDVHDARSWAPWWNRTEVLKKIKKVEILKKILDEYDLDLTDFCLGYGLEFRGVDCSLVGFRNEDDLAKIFSFFNKKPISDKINQILVRWNEDIKKID